MDISKVLSYATTGAKVVGNFFKTHKHTIATIGKYTLGGGAIVYAVRKAPETVHAIEDAGVRKGSELTVTEKAGIVVQKQAPAIAMGMTAVGIDIYDKVTSTKEVKEVKAENTSLIGQIAELSNGYNMVNDIRSAMQKRVEEDNGPEVVQEIRKESVQPYTHDIIAKARSEDAYVSDPKKIEQWNDIFLRTGDSDYKIQEYILKDCGQHILGCNYGFKYAEKEMLKLKSRETGRGYASQNDWHEMVGARPTQTGDVFIWRDQYEYFSTYIEPIEDNGVAMMLVSFGHDPYYDRNGDFSYM